MKISATSTFAVQRKLLTFRSCRNIIIRTLSGVLLGVAVLTPLHAATLTDGFGPLSLVRGAKPVQGGCGRPMAACTCGHSMATDMGMDMNVADAVVDPGLRLGGGELDASPTTLTVTNVGTSAYSVNGVNNPILTFVRGETYTFNINATGHPFYIKTVQGAGAGNAYTNGVTGNGTQIGTVTFTVPLDAPNSLFYDCANHAAMSNRIDVVPEPSVLVAITIVGLAAVVAKRRTRGLVGATRSSSR